MKASERVFFGKIMLFGEYSVLCKGKALMIPFKQFKARWKYSENRLSEAEAELNQEMKNYLLALVHNKKNKDINYGIDLRAFATDLKKGLYLDSDIPRGGGLGSSGALVASVYLRFALNPIPVNPSPDPKAMKSIQTNLARLESYFHGESSGLDPLISYIGKPLLIDSRYNPVSPVLSNESVDPHGGFFIINTRLERSTYKMVNLFRKKYQNADFQKMIHDMYIPVVDYCIDALLEVNFVELTRGIRQLSVMQLNYFSQMIPEGFEELWEKGLKTGQFYIKFCGAGGGGYLLGYTQNYVSAQNILEKANIQLIPISLTEVSS